jgi:DinB family protein
MPNSFDQFLGEFRETIVDATTRLRDITPEQSRNKVSDDNWSRIEILGHLVDSAANNHQRFVRAQFTDDLVFPGYEQNGWVSVQKYQDESWPELIQLWGSYNLHFVHVFAAIPESTRTKSREKHNLDEIALGGPPKSQPSTLEYLMRDYVDHLRHHLNQIFAQTS